LCENLTSIELNSGLTTIGEYAFEGAGLISMVIPNSVHTIGGGLFNKCSSLKHVSLGENINIGGLMFGGCTALETVVLSNPNPTSIAPNAFDPSVFGSVQILVPLGSESNYQALLSGASITTTPVAGYSVIFYSKGGTLVQPQGIEAGEVATKPEDPIMTGYSFDKWLNSADDTEWNFATIVTETIELYATYVVNKYDITLNPNGGSVSVTKIENVTYGTSIGTLPTPRRVNHIFDGWFDSDGNEYNSGDIFAPAVPENFVLNASWTPVVRTQYTVTINPLSGVNVNKTSTTVGEGNSFSFTAEAIASGYSVNVFVNGSPLSAISGITYLIEEIKENKTVTFSLTAGGATPNPDTDPVAPGDGNGNNGNGGNNNNGDNGSGNNGGGQIIIDENTPSEIPGEFPPTGEIIIRPPLVDPNSPTPPTVIIDGKEVEGEWKTDEDGNPIFVIEFDDLEDGKHTLVINDKEFEFTTNKNAGATSNDVLSTATVTAGYGTVTIDTPKSATVSVVSFSGSVVYNAKVIGSATVNVPAGIYVVVVDGTVTKVVVR